MSEHTKPAGLLQARQPDMHAIRTEVVAGLSATPATTSPKYLYDALGAKLFEAICELPEYYLTRAETAILKTHREEIAESTGTGMTLIDLGAGNCMKASLLLSALRPAQYAPVDICAEFVAASAARVRESHPGMEVIALGLDFSEGLDLPDEVNAANRLFFYPGSSIGNFTPAQALAFLKRLHRACGGGGLLIGVDLVKEPGAIDAAYSDALGVTAAFNLNLLLHLNRLLGADFDVRGWRHRGFFNREQRRAEMHLEARRRTVVRWPGGERRFEEGERIHTESSYKYAPGDFRALLREAGFDVRASWTGEAESFMVCHAKAA